jgi:HPr kinase/phosphorylase
VNARTREVSVKDFAADTRLSLRLIAGESGLARPIRHPRVQKNGLALAGHFHGVVPTRVQLLGETELSYLAALPEAERSIAVRSYLALGLSCIVVTKGETPPASLLAAANATGTPVFSASTRTSATINTVHAVLDDLLAPSTQLHGVLVDVFGVGLLLLGKSGIGKSECALELVLRGHRLVADDVVQCDYRPPGMIFGAPSPKLRDHIEIRGLGILNIRDMFGVTSVRARKRVDVIIRLVEWQEDEEYERLGVEDFYELILETRVRCLKVPVRPGRDMGSILEIAARNELLRRAGTHSAKNFIDRLSIQPESMSPSPAAASSRRIMPAPGSSVAALAASMLREASNSPSEGFDQEESAAWVLPRIATEEEPQ